MRGLGETRRVVSQLGADFRAGLGMNRSAVPQGPQEFPHHDIHPQRLSHARRIGAVLATTGALLSGSTMPADAIELPVGVICGPAPEGGAVTHLENEEKFGVVLDFSLQPNGTVSQIAQIAMRDESWFHRIQTHMTHADTYSLLDEHESEVILDVVDQDGSEHNVTRVTTPTGAEFDIFVNEIGGNTGNFDMSCTRNK